MGQKRLKKESENTFKQMKYDLDCREYVTNNYTPKSLLDNIISDILN